MELGKTRLLRAAAAAVLAGTGVLGACDGPTDPAEGRSAVPGEPSLLITPACAGGGGQTHLYETITTAQTWTRANSPHRVSGTIDVREGGRLTIAPGAVVCFTTHSRILAWQGGRVVARGRDTARIVFTAHDPATGWHGLDFGDGGTSYLTNVRIEHVSLFAPAVEATGNHTLFVDSAVIRKSGRGVVFSSPNASISRSLVDSTTDRGNPAVLLVGGGRFERTVVRGAAGVGVQVIGDGVQLRGGRIEGSGGVGLQIQNNLGRNVSPVRVTGGRSYGVEMPLHTLARLYPTAAVLDSLRGNARDTIVVTWSVLKAPFTAAAGLPLLVTQGVIIDSLGVLAAKPGAAIVFREGTKAAFTKGGRLVSRGSAANPVLFTAEDPARGWYGLSLFGTVKGTSYLTNSVVEYVHYNAPAVEARDSQRIVVDSSVIRWSGAAAVLSSPNSRISRTRVDTTLNKSMPAVDLSSNALVESVRVLAPAGEGLYIRSAAVVVTSCEVRDGDQEGIEMEVPVTIRRCNLVNNRLGGLYNKGSTLADARNNWWGSAGGPGSPGWNHVYGATYTPWRTTPYVLPYVP